MSTAEVHFDGNTTALGVGMMMAAAMFMWRRILSAMDDLVKAEANSNRNWKRSDHR